MKGFFLGRLCNSTIEGPEKEKKKKANKGSNITALVGM